MQLVFDRMMTQRKGGSSLSSGWSGFRLGVPFRILSLDEWKRSGMILFPRLILIGLYPLTVEEVLVALLVAPELGR